MNHFAYSGGVLHAEEVPLPEIAAAVGTPFYCYSTATLVRHYRVFREAFVFVAVTLVLLFRPQGLIPARGLRERI